jgi:hypothetical protein
MNSPKHRAYLKHFILGLVCAALMAGFTGCGSTNSSTASAVHTLTISGAGS